ncbi:hypothetical protein AYI70_g3103 [Smittium culicis]|uniref:Uncharacterized protein n=1 Tax=Smittium culicis TaxID=133412 RepID=A0A1R1Y566_9FUNG|nr:hypothetical protein AYI70_g3103 [Smittium culicis]
MVVKSLFKNKPWSEIMDEVVSTYRLLKKGLKLVEKETGKDKSEKKDVKNGNSSVVTEEASNLTKVF